VSGIENGLLELAAAANEFWPIEVITSAAWKHSLRPGCLGFTLTTNGRAFCGHCGWQVVPRSGQLALLALARIGETVAIAQHVAETYADLYLSDAGAISDVQIDGNGGFSYSVKLEVDLKSVSFTHRVDL
jgi:hypothetical protein